MAVLDRRVIPLIQLLTETGLDWLAFELVEGIRRGREPEEAPETLAQARERARGAEKYLEHANGAPGYLSKPILGDDQVEWAVKYIEERLGEAIATMSVTLSNLDQIIIESAPQFKRSGEGPITTLVLTANDEEQTVDPEGVELAKASLPKLSQSLAIWLEQARSTGA